MFRTSDIILISVMIGAAAVTYTIKHRAENTLAGIRDLDRQIRYEQDTIDLLKADWSLLKQPSRLQTLTETYKEDLGLQDLDPNQIGEASEIPERPLGIEDVIDGNLGDTVAKDGSAADPIETGGVKP
ncbi:MAG: hypothetical protein H6891_06815 [Brucellaceae bacterium]|nr:hypothetical protein [Brucellaceae bacterium]